MKIKIIIVLLLLFAPNVYANDILQNVSVGYSVRQRGVLILDQETNINNEVDEKIITSSGGGTGWKNNLNPSKLNDNSLILYNENIVIEKDTSEDNIENETIILKKDKNDELDTIDTVNITKAEPTYYQKVESPQFIKTVDVQKNNKVNLEPSEQVDILIKEKSHMAASDTENNLPYWWFLILIILIQIIFNIIYHEKNRRTGGNRRN